jgi:hypothetical protein
VTFSNDEQSRIWEVLYGRIKEVMHQFGTENYLGKGDYLIVDDNYGFQRHTIEIHNLSMLKREVMRALQLVLREFPGWEIVVAVDIPNKERIWPAMGLTIRNSAIIDELRRDVLPAELQNVVF